MKYPLIALAAIGTVITATPAMAGEAKVAYHDLNLASVEGQETLKRRISQAAKQVCGYNDLNTGTRAATPDMRRCLAKAKASASQQMAVVIDEERLGG